MQNSSLCVLHSNGCLASVGLLRMVAPYVGLCRDSGRGILWCHQLSCDASAAVTDLGENYVQMRMETKTRSSLQIRGVLAGNSVKFLILWFTSRNGVTRGRPPPLVTPLSCIAFFSKDAHDKLFCSY